MAFSVAVHGLLIFGFLQTLPVLFDNSPLPLSLDVTLTQTGKDKAPEKAYLRSGQAQQGILSLEPEREQVSAETDNMDIIAAQSNAQYVVPLGYRDDALYQKYKHAAVKRRTISAASHAAEDADYLAQWRDTIEREGTARYRQSIANQQTSGDLLMLVAIDQQGNLLEIQIRRSSGNPDLDALALGIVRDAAPFPPLPEAMQQNTEVLEILRTWKFRAGS